MKQKLNTTSTPSVSSINVREYKDRIWSVTEKIMK